MALEVANPLLRPLLAEPRFQAFLARYGLSDAQLAVIRLDVKPPTAAAAAATGATSH
jgi:hypothetical protein